MNKQLNLLDNNELNSYEKELIQKAKGDKFISEMDVNIIDEMPNTKTKKDITIHDYIRFNNKFYQVKSVLRHQLWVSRLNDTAMLSFCVEDVESYASDIQGLLEKGDLLLVKNEFRNIQEVMFIELLKDGGLYVYDELLGATLVLKNYEIKQMKGKF